MLNYCNNPKMYFVVNYRKKTARDYLGTPYFPFLKRTAPNSSEGVLNHCAYSNLI